MKFFSIRAMVRRDSSEKKDKNEKEEDKEERIYFKLSLVKSMNVSSMFLSSPPIYRK